MDDYYSLLGVEPDAPVDDIRAAYRDKKAAIVGDDRRRQGRTPRSSTRRGTCSPIRTSAVATTSSARRPSTAATLAESDDADETPSTNGRRPARAASRAAANRAQPLQPTIELPSGMHFAGRRQRLIAMAIDLVVLLVLFVGITQFGAQALAKNQKPEVVENVKHVQQARSTTSTSKLDDREESGQGRHDEVRSRRRRRRSDRRSATLEKKVKDTTKQRDDEVVQAQRHLLRFDRRDVPARLLVSRRSRA